MQLIRFQKDIPSNGLSHALTRLKRLGYEFCVVNSPARNHIEVLVDTEVGARELAEIQGVQAVVNPGVPYFLASREFQPDDTQLPLGIGWQRGRAPLIIGGPCSVESRSQVLEIAFAVREAGADAFRGGAFKPRTSPYDFQGIGKKGYEYLAEVREQTGLPVVSEVMSVEQARYACEYIDVLQVGARNMQNIPLLKALGKLSKPVLLKRGLSATLEELLLSAEYILKHGNRQVMLCERGIRTFETATRFTFDANAIPVLKERTHLPVLSDPSHATGRREYVEPISLAAIAAGSDGLIIEVHSDPGASISDDRQTMRVEDFSVLVKKVRQVYALIHAENFGNEQS